MAKDLGLVPLSNSDSMVAPDGSQELEGNGDDQSDTLASSADTVLSDSDSDEGNGNNSGGSLSGTNGESDVDSDAGTSAKRCLLARKMKEKLSEKRASRKKKIPESISRSLNTDEKTHLLKELVDLLSNKEPKTELLRKLLAPASHPPSIKPLGRWSQRQPTFDDTDQTANLQEFLQGVEYRHYVDLGRGNHDEPNPIMIGQAADLFKRDTMTYNKAKEFVLRTAGNASWSDFKRAMLKKEARFTMLQLVDAWSKVAHSGTHDELILEMDKYTSKFNENKKKAFDTMLLYRYLYALKDEYTVYGR